MRYLITRGLEEEALHFGNSFQSLEYFSHAQEVLLHQVLEEEADKKSRYDPTTALLPLIVRFYENYYSDFYLDVIVRCARKTEVSHWGFFFSVVGDPKILFRVEKSVCFGNGI